MTFRRLVALASAFAITFAVAGCSPEVEPTPTPTPSPTASAPAPQGDGVLTIGTLLQSADDPASAARIAGVELALRDVANAGDAIPLSVVALHRVAGGTDSPAADQSFAELLTRGVDVVIGPSEPAQSDRIAPLAQQSGVVLLPQVAEAPASVAELFTDRVRLMDPAVRDTSFAAEAYDAVIFAVLAALVAGDDAGASVAFGAEQLLEGAVECGSLGECLYVLEDRRDIRYVPLSGEIPWSQQTTDSAESKD